MWNASQKPYERANLNRTVHSCESNAVGTRSLPSQGFSVKWLGFPVQCQSFPVIWQMRRVKSLAAEAQVGDGKTGEKWQK